MSTSPSADRTYFRGFGQAFQSEAISGALPRRNNPKVAPMGLYSELITTTAFMSPREQNRHAYVFRIRPSVAQSRPQKITHPTLLTAPLAGDVLPIPLRWSPIGVTGEPIDFVDSLATICGNGDARLQTGGAIHVFRANRSMHDRFFASHDGELLILPQEGAIIVATEFGILDVEPGELAIVPRGIKFRVELAGDKARGLVCENYGVPFRLPELGPLGSVGLANPLDFLVPTAAFEDRAGEMEQVQKIGGVLWSSSIDHSPLDVVAWRGTTAPVKYRLEDFSFVGNVTADHADPSIFTALTSPSDPVLGSNMDFLIIGPQWFAVDDTFRSAPFHRNCSFELASVIKGASPNKASGTGAGTMYYHNSQTPHGPDPLLYDRVSTMDDTPLKLENALMIAFESRLPVVVTEFALTVQECEADYAETSWAGWRESSRRLFASPA